MTNGRRLSHTTHEVTQALMSLTMPDMAHFLKSNLSKASCLFCRNHSRLPESQNAALRADYLQHAESRLLCVVQQPTSEDPISSSPHLQLFQRLQLQNCMSTP